MYGFVFVLNIAVDIVSNTKKDRAEFLERERQLLREMDEKGETLFDHDLMPEKMNLH